MRSIAFIFLLFGLISCQAVNTNKSDVSKSCFFNEKLMKDTMVFNVFFDFNKYNISASEKQQLFMVVEALKASPEGAKVSLLGYTDQVGKPSYNKRLAENRVKAVKQFIKSHGFKNIDLVEGVGESRLKNDCNDLKNKSERNDCNDEFRRVEVSIYPKQ